MVVLKRGVHGVVRLYWRIRIVHSGGYVFLHNRTVCVIPLRFEFRYSPGLAVYHRLNKATQGYLAVEEPIGPVGLALQFR